MHHTVAGADTDPDGVADSGTFHAALGSANHTSDVGTDTAADRAAQRGAESVADGRTSCATEPSAYPVTDQ